MTTLGIVGGIGPESTMVYYRALVAAYRERRRDGSYPSIVINSIDLTRMVGYIERGELTALTDYLVSEVERLAQAGARLGLLAANAPHIVFDEVWRQVSIPMVSIVDATCAAAQALGLARVGLIGARFTMRAQFYPSLFAAAGIAVVVPTAEEQAYIHEKYMGELVNGVVVPDTREQLLLIADRLRALEGIQGLILGGTELSLILGGVTHAGLRMLDTTQIHVQRAAALAWPV